MEISYPISGVLAIYLQSAGLAGLGVDTQPDALLKILYEGNDRFDAGRLPTAVSSALKLIACALEAAEEEGSDALQDRHVHKAQDRICPIYPFQK